ncbi:RNA 2',3'-cyclic phosphodiesterase [Candidatus Nomurabacteria bacterium]|nr:RNA 2',3'-cyclic phosphodiesterase [Candidatus Nomurabacteria bacterium]
MEHQRLFISIPIDQLLAKKINKDLALLDLPKSRLKFTKLENFHLTIKFLGDTPIDNLDEIIKNLDLAHQNVEAFELEIEKTQIFPENEPDQTPRVLSLGFKKNEQLQKLYNSIEEQLWQVGLAHKEVRNFTPHLTLAKVYPGVKRKDLQSFLDWQVHGLSYVDHFELQESVLQKGGPQYTVLNTFDL